MAIAIRGGSPLVASTAANPISGTLTGTRQPQAGDLLVIVHGNDFYDLASMPTPTVGGSTSGVTAITNGSSDAGNPDAHVKTYTYVVGSTGDLTVSVSETGTPDEEKVLAVYVLSGADTSNPIDGGSNGAAGTASGTQQTSMVLTGVIPTGSDAFLIYHVNSGGGTAGGTPYTPPSGGFTEQYDTATGAISYTGGTLQLAVSGATGSKTVTGNGSSVSWAGVLLAVKTGGAVAATEYAGPYRGPAPGRISPTGVRRPQPPGDARPVVVVAVGIASETDTALALGRIHTRALGIAAETDTAITLGRTKTRALGVATETDTARPVTASHVRTLGVAAETDAALPLAGIHTRALGIASETDTAQGVTGSVTGIPQPYAGPWTGMTPGWQSPTGQLSVIFGNATVANITTAALGIAAETDTAQPLGRTKTRAVGTASETDTALAVGRVHTRALGVAAETDTARPLGKAKARAVGIAATTDTAIALGRAKRRLIGTASCTDIALPIGSAGHIVRPAGTAAETDTAGALGRLKRRTVGVATTTDAALALGHRWARTLGVVGEVDTALAFPSPAAIIHPHPTVRVTAYLDPPTVRYQGEYAVTVRLEA